MAKTSSCLLLSFPKTVYRKHKNNSAWAHYGNSQTTNYCQVRPQSLGIALLLWQPSIQEHGAEGWLCAGAGCDVLRGVCMMSSCGMEGANQTLRKLCHLLFSRSIQGYRSAVNWELQRGHFFPELCMCVRKSGGEKKKWGGASKSIVDMLMLLTISRAIKMSWSSTSKTTAPGPSQSFSFLNANDLVPHNLILNMIPMMLWATCQNIVKHQHKSWSTLQ